MGTSALRQRMTEKMLRDVREATFPNVTTMSRLEAALGTREELEEYIEVLVQRVEDSPHPNLPLLRRVDGLLERLERLEQAEKQQ